MRDYGTGLWDGGDPDCDHRIDPRPFQHGEGRQGNAYGTPPGGNASRTATYSETCGKCDARRVDQQLGLEPTPDLFVSNMVAVFREVRRVLASHGTCWVNLGDSYAAGKAGRTDHGTDDPTVGLQGNSLGAQAPGAVILRSAPEGFKPKDLVGIPWRVAFALQQDGWYLRADIIWAKPNPMPESVTDRPTKAHEYVFLLTKEPRYYFDQEAVREPAEYGFSPTTRGKFAASVGGKHNSHTVERGNGAGGRNVRSVWQIATQPYPEAHFATYPEELVRRCVLAGCPVRVCDAIVCSKCAEPHHLISGRDINAFTADGEAVSVGCPAQEELRRVWDVLRGDESVHLFSEVSGDQDTATSSDCEAAEHGGARTDLSSGLHQDEAAGSSPCDEGLRSRTPGGDGASSRSAVELVGEGASPERGSGGQPPIESGDRDAFDASGSSGVSELRSALLRALTCVSCGHAGFRVCGKPSERIVESRSVDRPDLPRDHPEWRPSRYDNGKAGDPQSPGPGQRFSETSTMGWSDCGHNDWRPGVTLDPFIGSGTTCKVARDHGRHSIGIDLSADYLALAARRLQQLSLLT